MAITARPGRGVGRMACEAQQSAVRPVEVGGDAMPATCERCWAEPAVAWTWRLPPGFVGERCRAELAGRSGPIVISRSG